MADSENDSNSSDGSQSMAISGQKPPHIRRRPSNVDLAKEEIICPMCIGVFNTPKSLQCLHSYCENCIECLLKSSNDKTSIICPECRANTPMPDDGIKGLPINFKLQRFVEILSSKQKQDILSRSVSIKKAKADSIPKPIEQDKISLNCTIHEDKQLEYYCKECALLVCGKCMLDEHRMHQEVKYATEALPEQLAAMKTSLVFVEATLSVSKAYNDSLGSDIMELKNDAELVASTVTNYFQNIHKLLQEREASILEEISSDVSKKEEVIIKQQRSIQVATNELQKCVDHVQDIGENRKSDVKVLVEEERIKARIEHHKNQLELVVANIKIKGTQIFKSPFNADSYFEAQCKTVGENPYERPLIPLAAMSKIDEFHGPVPPPISAFRPRTRTMHPSEKSRDSLSSTSSISPDCSHAGRHSLPSLNYSRNRFSGFYDNEDIFDSDSLALPYLEITSRQLLGSSPRLASIFPNGVCVGKPDCLIVTDSRNGILRILTPTGKCLDSVVIESKGEGNMVDPTAVATSEEGTMYLIIRGTSNKIQKYSSSGKYLTKLKGRGQLGDPTGITVLPNGNVLVSDSQKGCIHVYDSTSGKYQGKLDIMEMHQPDSPSDITHDHRGNLIISDLGNHCVWVYSSNGRYVTRLGTKGTNPGELLQPYSVAADLDSNIFVAESGNHRVSVFTLSGKFVRCFGTKGSEPGMFLYPRHLCVDSQGRLVVADEQNHRLQIFDIKELLNGF